VPHRNPTSPPLEPPPQTSHFSGGLSALGPATASWTTPNPGHNPARSIAGTAIRGPRTAARATPRKAYPARTRPLRRARPHPPAAPSPAQPKPMPGSGSPVNKAQPEGPGGPKYRDHRQSRRVTYCAMLETACSAERRLGAGRSLTGREAETTQIIQFGAGGSRWMAAAARAAGRRPASAARLQGRCWPGIGYRHIRQVRSPVVEAVAVQMHKLVPGWTRTRGRLSHELVHPFLFLV
jgi:hypothetical protein